MNRKTKNQNSFLFSCFKYRARKKWHKKIFGLVFSRFLFFTLGLFLSVAVFTAYADWDTQVLPGELLTADKWNTLVDYVDNYAIQNIAEDQGLIMNADNNIGIRDCAADQIVQRSADGATWICADNFVATGWNHIVTRNIQMSNFWLSGDGGDEGIFIDTNGNVGIGTTTPSYALEVEGGDAYFNNDVYMGSLEFLQDSGMVSAFDMQVTASAPDNTVEGYVFSVDGSQILTIYSQSNGAGSVDTTRVGIGTTTPGAKLDVVGDMKIFDGGAFGGYSPSGIYKVTTPTLYAEQAQVGNPAGGLKGLGSINVSTICIEGVCQNSWSGIGSAGGWTDDGTTVRLTAIGDKVGIGTTTSGYKLSVVDTGSVPMINIWNNSASNQWTGTRLARGGTGDGTEKWFIGMDNSDSKLRFRRNGATDDLIIDTNGNVGIGTTTPSYALEVEGGDAYFNNDVYMGSLEFLQDSGMVSAFDMQVTASAPDNMVEGYVFSVDGSQILTIYSQSNGAGSVDTARVGIGTTTPGAKLDVVGDMKIFDGGAFGGYSPSGIYKVTTPTLYAEQAQVGNPAGGLKGLGSINVSTICIGGVCQNSWSGIGSVGGWTDDGTTVRLTAIGDKVGIGTTAPSEKLEIKDDANSSIAKLRITDTNDNPEFQLQYGSLANEHWSMYVNNFDDSEVGQEKSLNLWSYNDGVSYGNRMTILQDGNVGIGTANPQKKLHIVKGAGALPMLIFNPQLVIQNNDAVDAFAGISIIGGDAGHSFISFGDKDADSRGKIAYFHVDDSMQFMTAGTNRMIINSSGLEVAGNLWVSGTFNAGGADVAEEFTTLREIEKGTVVVMGDNGYKSAKPCDSEYDVKVIGVVSDNPAVIMGRVESEHKAIIAISGVVTVKAVSKNGAIKKGDLLATSNFYGCAMKALDAKVGTVFGKALEDCDQEKCEIKALINLQ